MKNIKLQIIIFILVTFITGCSYSEDKTKTHTGGGVDVSITFNPMDATDEYWINSMYIDTHSVNLEKYNYEELLYVYVDDKLLPRNKIIFETEGSGHHLKQYIKIPKSINMIETISDKNHSLVIELKNVAGVESRIFEWDLTNIQNLGEKNYVQQ